MAIASLYRQKGGARSPDKGTMNKVKDKAKARGVLPTQEQIADMVATWKAQRDGVPGETTDSIGRRVMHTIRYVGAFNGILAFYHAGRKLADANGKAAVAGPDQMVYERVLPDTDDGLNLWSPKSHAARGILRVQDDPGERWGFLAAQSRAVAGSLASHKA